MAMRVSRSGFWMSAIRPISNRDRSLSSSVGISLGGRSDESMICFPLPWSSLKVWNTSCWVESLPAMNWISSIISTSTLRTLSRRAEVFLRAMPSTNWFTKLSEVM